MLSRVLAPLALVVLLLMGGAPQVTSERDPGPWLRGAGHDHRDPAQHAGIARGLHETDWLPLGGDMLHMSGAHAMEVRNGTLFVAAFSDMYGASGGLWTLDVRADPRHPRVLGHLPGLGPMGGDRSLDATVDGDFAVVGTEAAPAAYTKTGIVNPTPSGLLLVDARDKTRPLVVDYHPSAGVHSVIVGRVNGADYVYTSDLLNQPFSVYRIDREPTPKLVPVGRQLIRHDASLFHDPVLGKTLLVTADGSSGILDEVRVYDASANPATPVRLGNWSPPDPTTHFMHSALMTYVEGRRVIVVTSENAGDAPTPIWFLDATDLGNITTLATWKPPVGGGNGLVFSLHNPRIHQGLLHVAHYHAGIVVFDIRTLAALQDLPVVGYAVPSHDTGYRSLLDPAQLAAGIDAIHYPRVYDVAVDPETGHFYAADVWTGVTAYRPADS